MNQILKSVLGWLAYFLILFVLIYGIPKAMSAALNTPYPMASITSGSMWPALKTGDLVFIQGLKTKNDVKIGDIIVYRNPSINSIGSGQALGFTIHRVIKINDGTVVTKGDANSISDLPVRYEEIVGKTLTYKNNPIRIPSLGSISILMNKNKF